VLVFRIGELGDTLIAFPAFWAVRRHFPGAHLCLLTNELQASGGKRSRSVLPETGLFDSFLEYPSSTSGTPWRSALRLYQGVARGRFDLLVYLAPRLRSPLQVQRDLLFFRTAGIHRVVGHSGFEPMPRHSPGAQLPTIQHESDHLLSRLKRSGIPADNGGLFSRDLLLQPDEKERARTWLESERVPEDRAIVGFGPSSAHTAKMWPEERYRELGSRLIQAHNIHPVVFGGANDAAMGARLIKAWGRGSNAAGVLWVREAAAAMEQCVLYVGNDTGTTHLAAAAGAPCVAVYSAQDWPGKWHPYGARHVVIRRDVPCAGCRLTTCTTNKLRCLTEINADEVFEACSRQLAELPRVRRGGRPLPVL
jgi:ADP-heptose:LPS heptosyltransferase